MIIAFSTVITSLNSDRLTKKVGAASGPYLMGHALAHQNSWNMGYCYVGLFQIVLTAT